MIIDINKNGRKISYLENYYKSNHSKNDFHAEIEKLIKTKPLKVCKVTENILIPISLASSVSNKEILEFENISKFRYNVFSFLLNGRKSIIYDSNKKDWFYLQIGSNHMLLEKSQLLELLQSNKEIEKFCIKEC